MTIKRCVLVLVCVLILLSLETGTASASPQRLVYYYMVDSNADTSDKLPGDKNCDDGTGACTLRAAIEEANADKGMSVIKFSKPFTSSNAITINKPLVLTEDYTTIDASSQWSSSSTCGGHGVRILAHSSSWLSSGLYAGMLTIKSSHNEVYGLDFFSHDITAVSLQFSGAQYNTIGAVPAKSDTINTKSNAFETIGSSTSGGLVVGVLTITPLSEILSAQTRAAMERHRPLWGILASMWSIRMAPSSSTT
jgi:hypothetical protein